MAAGCHCRNRGICLCFCMCLSFQLTTLFYHSGILVLWLARQSGSAVVGNCCPDLGVG